MRHLHRKILITSLCESVRAFPSRRVRHMVVDPCNYPRDERRTSYQYVSDVIQPNRRCRVASSRSTHGRRCILIVRLNCRVYLSACLHWLMAAQSYRWLVMQWVESYKLLRLGPACFYFKRLQNQFVITLSFVARWRLNNNFSVNTNSVSAAYIRGIIARIFVVF